jgi:hypothetical protein
MKEDQIFMSNMAKLTLKDHTIAEKLFKEDI